MKKIIPAFILLITTTAFSQSSNSSKPPINWQLMDWQQDGYPGISVEKAYNELLKNKKPQKKIIIAVIDCGLDATHPDLAGMQWTNKKEIPGNGIDDDHNGFVDDIHGWNFGGNATHETQEAVREYVRLRGKYENKSDTSSFANDPGYVYWKRVIAEKERLLGNSLMTIVRYLQDVQSYLSRQLKTDSVNIGNIRQFRSIESSDSFVIKTNILNTFFVKNKQVPDSISLISFRNGLLQYIHQQHEADPRTTEANIVIEKNDPAYFRKKELGDDPYINNGNHYGNNNTAAYPGTIHATNIAGTIAALRNNGIGGNGITNSVEIMTIILDAAQIDRGRSDEWDKDVANSIRYAVDNGAQIVNMSFGKYLSPQQQWVIGAMKYAEQHGVLLCAAAGNDHTNDDSKTFFPFAYSNNDIISNLIKVGASTYDSSLIAGFSNYGKENVDVFAPGTNIYTTSPENKYEWVDGTSFATPMVAGLAALIWSYYPTLTYKQIKYCIEKSATPINTLVTKPGTIEKVSFSSLSRTGGIVNAYKAILIAEKIIKKHL
jgi:cell wall-associated protease